MSQAVLDTGAFARSDNLAVGAAALIESAVQGPAIPEMSSTSDFSAISGVLQMHEEMSAIS
jgi:hypothetical protein